MSELLETSAVDERGLPATAATSLAGQTSIARNTEPRWLTMADLMAVLAGLSVALAMMPEAVRALFQLSAWEADRYPDPRSRVLLVFLLGSWLVVVLGIAVLPAVIWRLWRYARAPLAAEWLLLILIIGLPPLDTAQAINQPLSRFCRRLGIEHAFVDDYSDYAVHPTFVAMVAGALACIFGLWLLQRFRHAHPVLRSVSGVALLIIFITLPGQYGWNDLLGVGGDNFGDVNQLEVVPHWNSVSWQEFAYVKVDVTLRPGVIFVMGVCFALAVREAMGRRSLRCWTELAGLVMLVATVVLYLLLVFRGYDSLPPWFASSALLVVAFGVSWPLEWCRRRWWA